MGLQDIFFFFFETMEKIRKFEDLAETLDSFSIFRKRDGWEIR